MLVVEFVDLDADDPERERRFSEKMACPNDHPLQMDEVEPRSFSFNSPFGACPECTGIGTELEVDPDLIVPDEDLSLADGAIAPWASGSGAADYFQRVMAALADDLKFSMTTPWRALPQRAQEALLHGKNHKVHVRYRNRYGRERSYSTGFEGVVAFVKRRHAETDSDWSRERYEGYMREVPVPGVQGRPAQARVAGRAHRRQVDRARSPASPSPMPRGSSTTSTSPCASGRSPSGSSRRSTPGSASCSTSGSTTSASTARPARCPAARRSASGSPPRSAPAWSACSTCSTSRASGCTSATTTG